MPPSRFRFFVQAGRSFKPRFAISLQFKSRHDCNEKHRTWKIGIAWTPPNSRNNKKRTSLAWPKQVTEKKREVIGSADNRARKNAHTHTRRDIDMNTHTHARTCKHMCDRPPKRVRDRDHDRSAEPNFFFRTARFNFFFYFRDLFQLVFQSYYRRNFFVNNHLLLSRPFSLRTCENRGRNLKRWRLWLLSNLSRMQNNYFCW